MASILALDQGTTSSRAIVFDPEGNITAVAQREFEQIFPNSGWVEHNPHEIWSSQIAVAAEALAKAGLTPRDVAALGITNQRETTLLWDRQSGEPIHNAIVWQDRRTAPICDRLRAEGRESMVREKTGLVIDAYFSGTKIAWLLGNVEGARQKAEAGQLAFGTVDSWLIWKLTGGALHATDATNASRTMLYNIRSGEWDDELLAMLDVPRSLLPEVRSSSEVYAEAAVSEVRGVPIAGVAGDQQAALFGQLCFDRGMAKNTYGTGCFALMNIGAEATLSNKNLVTTVAWKLAGRTEYAMEGSIFIAGAVVQWLRDGLGLISTASEIEPLAASVKDNGGVYLVPAFAGLGAPHWDPYARGILAGITRGTTRAHIARAALEGIAYQVADILELMRDDTGIDIQELRVDGGAAANNLLMQFQADILGAPIVRPAVTETTAQGAAYLAGLATGVWKAQDDIRANVAVDRRFEPAMPREQAAELRGRWQAALERAKGWEQ
ncbi:MAG: glycerol kinase GlpK [Bryobacterales bacterium]